jgi:tetratricopeptide (TPR) repeat protein
MKLVNSGSYDLFSRIRMLLFISMLLPAFQTTLYSQGTSLPIFNGRDETISLVVYNSPVYCKKNFSVQLNLKRGLRNSDELVKWRMDYTGCDGKRYAADMSTPIGRGAKNANDLLSFASSYSNELNLEHAFIFPTCVLENVQIINGIHDVVIVSSKSQSSHELTTHQVLSSSMEPFKPIVQSQTRVEAIQKTLSERFESAELDLNAIIANEPTIADNYAAAGYNYFYWGVSDQDDAFELAEKMESAERHFRKGMEVDPTNPLCFVGLGHLMAFRKEVNRNNEQFTKAEEIMNTTSNRVDELVKQQALLKMAEACLLDNNVQLEKAIVYINSALACNDQNPEVYIQLGDYYRLRDGINQSNAIAQYNKALEIDSKSTRAILRKGMLFKHVKSWDKGLNYYNEAIVLDPSFAPAHREKAELLKDAGRYPQAVEAYARYKELNENCRANQRYAMFVYLARDYQNALVELERALPCNDKNEYMYRVLGYVCYETGDYAKGLQYMVTYFNLAKASGRVKVSSYDYGHMGKLLSKSGQDSQAIEMLKQAIAEDPAYVEGYNEVASILMKQKKYADAANYYQQKIDHSETPAPLDFYYLAQSRYRNKEYILADIAFAQAASKYPDANFWRGRCKNTMEANPDQPEAGLAKPYYEKFIQIVVGDVSSIEANKKNLIEAYNYLAIYYLIHQDFACSRAAVNKALELDPANKVASILLNDENLMKTKKECLLMPKNE